MYYQEKPGLIFYQKIGELFYAIAASDKVVRKEEYQALRKLVVDEWKAMDSIEDPFHSDAAYQIEIVFEWFDYEGMDATDCFENFNSYFMENKKHFSPERKKLIYTTADAIAASFSGKNKSELIMLAKLKLLLKQ